MPAVGRLRHERHLGDHRKCAFSAEQDHRSPGPAIQPHAVDHKRPVSDRAGAFIAKPANGIRSHAAVPTETLRSLAAKVRVRRDARLEGQYPEMWPARVVVERSGKRKSIVVSTPLGDARNPMQWDDVLLKAARHRALLTAVREAKSQEPIPHQILEVLTFVGAVYDRP